MKTLKKALLFLLFIVCFMTTACNNNKQGVKGDKGDKGDTGQTGLKGDPGSTPYIGENGNWWIGNTDTGVRAGGQKGDTGAPGKDGTDGVDGADGEDGASAYEIYKKYHKSYKGTEEEWINALANGDLARSYNTTYNIIYTLATIPPVLAALDSIDNGYETYAMIERGKTYSGIAATNKFHNIGFNVSSNSSAGFTRDQFNLVVNKVKELNVYGNEKFNIYVQDGTALEALAIAANSELNSNQYNIIMCEDGRSAYSDLRSSYVAGKTVTAQNDEVYETYKTRVEYLTDATNLILSKNDNVVGQGIFGYNISNAFALASIENFTYWFQDKNQIKNILESATTTDSTKTKLLTGFGIEGYNDEIDLTLSVKYKSISEYVSQFDSNEKTNYLTLMYGNYYEDTYNTLTRTTLSDGTTSVPTKKLVFIGSRIKSFPTLMNLLGIGGATSASDIPDDYASLNAKYKNSLLFANESDYMTFINTVNNSASYLTAATTEQKDAVRVACFNYYLNYIFVMKYTYVQYGTEYDLIMKGHPSEVIGAYENWTNHYIAASYNYDKLMNDVCLAFHTSDSIGKYIGMVPYGTAAENLAYLGVDIAIAGLNSSTYTGYDTDVDVLFVLQPTNANITANANLNSRYEAGNLTYHKNGVEYTTKYDNTGNILKTLSKIYTDSSETELAELYKTKYEEWLKTAFGLDSAEGHDINDQGFLDA